MKVKVSKKVGGSLVYRLKRRLTGKKKKQHHSEATDGAILADDFTLYDACWINTHVFE